MATKISWTEKVWNFIVGCAKVSSGCMRCYAAIIAYRLERNPNPLIAKAYAGTTVRHANGMIDWSGKVNYLPWKVDEPRRCTTPKLWFVNSMADMFYGVPDEAYGAAWATMRDCPWHRFQILTKRPEEIAPTFERLALPVLPNVWLGTSVEDQRAACLRIPELLRVQAAKRFLSCEPLLGKIDLARWLATGEIHWVIAGAESNQGRPGRPMDLDWIRRIRDDCQRYGVGFYFKQAFEDGRKVERPFLDGRQWFEWPD